jgi:hypothetical protein
VYAGKCHKFLEVVNGAEVEFHNSILWIPKENEEKVQFSVNGGRLSFFNCTLINDTPYDLDTTCTYTNCLLKGFAGKIAPLNTPDEILGGMQNGAGAQFSVDMEKRTRDFLGGKIFGAGLNLVAYTPADESVVLEFNGKADWLSRKAGIRVFTENGERFSPEYTFSDDSRIITVGNLGGGRKYTIEINENLLSYYGPKGFAGKKVFRYPGE